MPKTYRPNVAAILQKSTGEILICQRADHPDCWQFPQGGIDEGENALQALQREIKEEIGIEPSAYQVVKHREGYRYDFPEGSPLKKGFIGQEQTYFLCRFDGQDCEIDLNTHEVEFIDFRWIMSKDFQASWLPAFKRKVVLQAMEDLLNT